jgi:hypothetical protein
MEATVSIARSVTRMAPLLGAVSCALFLVGCADKSTAPAATTNQAPTATTATRVIDLSRRPALRATVTTVATFRGRDGKVLKRQFSQRVRATFKKDLARTALEGTASAEKSGAMFAGLAEGSAQFAQFTSGAAPYTPVLAAASGTLASDYYDSQADSVGNVFEIYGWAADYYSPPTDVWAYRNGVLIVQFRANWTPVAGGYVLADQTLASFYEDGTLAATIVSTIPPSGGGGPCNTTGDGCVMMTENGESFSDRFKTPMFTALDRLGCWLGPKVAYAAVQCVRESLIFAGETFVLGGATYLGGPFVESAVAAGMWWAGWPLWTDSMYSMLRCFDSKNEKKLPRGRDRCQANPKAHGCGSGAGGGL